MNRLRRCRSFTPEQRTAILKQVRRYIADPPKPRTDRKISYKESDRYFEPQSQKQNGAKTEEENVRVQVKQDRLGQTQYKGQVFVREEKDLQTVPNVTNRVKYT
jgi:hypothetical protein